MWSFKTFFKKKKMKKKKRRRRLCNGSVNVRNKSVTSLLIWFHYGREISGFSSDLRRSEGEKKKKKKKWWQTDLTCIIWIWIRIYIYIYICCWIVRKLKRMNERGGANSERGIWIQRMDHGLGSLNSQDYDGVQLNELLLLLPTYCVSVRFNYYIELKKKQKHTVRL